METKYKPENKIGSFFSLYFKNYYKKALLHYIIINAIFMAD